MFLTNLTVNINHSQQSDCKMSCNSNNYQTVQLRVTGSTWSNIAKMWNKIKIQNNGKL